MYVCIVSLTSIRVSVSVLQNVTLKREFKVQRNHNLMNCQGTGETGSLYRGFVISKTLSQRIYKGNHMVSCSIWD